MALAHWISIKIKIFFRLYCGFTVEHRKKIHAKAKVIVKLQLRESEKIMGDRRYARKNATLFQMKEEKNESCKLFEKSYGLRWRTHSAKFHGFIRFFCSFIFSSSVMDNGWNFPPDQNQKEKKSKTKCKMTK